MNIKEVDDKIKKYAQYVKDEAYIEFESQHEYNPMDYCDPLILERYEIHGEEVRLHYKESTPHDRPYRVYITKTLKEIEQWQ